jgi:hypothetical protein
MIRRTLRSHYIMDDPNIFIIGIIGLPSREIPSQLPLSKAQKFTDLFSSTFSPP